MYVSQPQLQLERIILVLDKELIDMMVRLRLSFPFGDPKQQLNFE